MKTESLWRKERKTRRLVWAVKFLLMFLSVILVHALWPMRLDASWGWAGYLRAGLGGLLGGAFWLAFDVVYPRKAESTATEAKSNVPNGTIWPPPPESQQWVASVREAMKMKLLVLLYSFVLITLAMVNYCSHDSCNTFTNEIITVSETESGKSCTSVITVKEIIKGKIGMAHQDGVPCNNIEAVKSQLITTAKRGL